MRRLILPVLLLWTTTALAAADGPPSFVPAQPAQVEGYRKHTIPLNRDRSARGKRLTTEARIPRLAPLGKQGKREPLQSSIPPKAAPSPEPAPTLGHTPVVRKPKATSPAEVLVEALKGSK